MKFGSICSGIEAASVAWEPLGWKAVFFSEIEKFPCALLAERFSAVPNLGDMAAGDFVERARALGDIDLVVGGTPCQSFSFAGSRGSLGDDRGNLSLRFVEITHGLNPRYVLWENVPGILSTPDNAFGCFLAGLVGERKPLTGGGRHGGKWPNAGMVVGPRRSASWRVLDAQYFGVPQRRRRVFVVSGRIADGANPGAILFEPKKVQRNTEKGVQMGEGIIPPAKNMPGESIYIGFSHGDFGQDQGYILPTLRNSSGHGNAAVCFDGVVRRLTPAECERAQGFPREWTWLDNKTSDARRYATIGNSMAVPVMRWIGKRIELCDSIMRR